MGRTTIYTVCLHSHHGDVSNFNKLNYKIHKEKKPFDLPNMSGEEEVATRDDAIFQSLKCLFNKYNFVY